MNQLGKKRIAVIAAVVIVLILALIFILLYRKGIRATTMRLLRFEGTVTMEDNGASQAVKENLRLKSGNTLDTAVASLVSIGLDDTKIVTMDELSRSEFNQKGKYLNLNLTKGSIFFEVDKPLAENETFEIETSTMIVGIRGTSGWVSVSGENESLIITDGKVHVIGTNPVTGEVKEIDVKAGQRISVYLYNDREVDSIMFVLEDITERDLPDFVLRMLRENPELLDKVVRETGWDKPWILGITDAEEPEEESETKPDRSDPVITDPVEPEPIVVADLEPDDEEPVPAGNAQNNDADLPPVAVPTASALERQIQAALAQVVEVTADGDYILVDGTDFDPDYYAERYPDVVAIYGDKDEELLAHYVAHGQEEGRFANKTEEDDKLLADAIANAPAPSNNNTNTNTNTNTTNGRTRAVANPANTVTIPTNGTTVTFNGMNMSYTNGKVVINSSVNSSVTLPAYYDDGSGNAVELNLSDFDINANNITVVDASDIAPTILDMGNLVNSNNGLRVTNGLTSVSDGAVGWTGITQYQGTVASITTGSGQTSIDAFKLAYEELMRQNSTSITVKGVNYGNGIFTDNTTTPPSTTNNVFGIAYDNTAFIGTVQFPNTSINWNAAGGPRITAPNAVDGNGNVQNYVIDGTITGDGFRNN